MTAGAALLLWLLSFLEPLAQPGASRSEGKPARATIPIAYITRAYPKPQYLSLVQKTPDDLGNAGARLALDEINVAAKFIGHAYALEVRRLKGNAPMVDQLRAVLAETKLLIADLEPEELLALADMPEAKDAVILDVRTSDDALRQENCRRNAFHILPSTAMRADALGQYLMEKRWPRWFLIKGTSAADEVYAADLVRTAKRFGAKIVETRSYGYDTGSRRVDTGYQQIQSQMPMATRNVPGHDVLVVADTADVFGDYLPYATAEPRPVVGTQGLVATAWAPAFQEYSALQMQRRFETAARRPMQEADYAGWLAVRTIGEAVMRSKKTAAIEIGEFMRSSEFAVAGFKGQALTFRPRHLQLRQPVLLATPLMVVSISPQEGFLHPKFLTDTLGFDEPESKCHLAS